MKCFHGYLTDIVQREPTLHPYEKWQLLLPLFKPCGAMYWGGEAARGGDAAQRQNVEFVTRLTYSRVVGPLIKVGPTAVPVRRPTASSARAERRAGDRRGSLGSSV